MKFLEIESTPSLPAAKLPAHDIKALGAPPPRRTGSPASSGAAGKRRLLLNELLCPQTHRTAFSIELLFLFFLHRRCGAPQATRRVQPFPGPPLCRGPPGGGLQLWRLRKSPADEAHLRRPAHLHTCAGLIGGQCWIRAQGLVEAVIGPIKSPRQTYFLASTVLCNRVSFNWSETPHAKMTQNDNLTLLFRELLCGFP